MVDRQHDLLLSQLAVKLGMLQVSASPLADVPTDDQLLAAFEDQRHQWSEAERAALDTLAGRFGVRASGRQVMSDPGESEPSPRAMLPAIESYPSDRSGPSIDPVEMATGFEPAPTDSRFRILRLCERGGLGEVYLAHDEQLHREVALKQIRASKADDSDNRRRFLAEAEITGRLEHPGIVPVYGLGRYADGRPFYAMRYVNGRSLRVDIDRLHADAHPLDAIRLRSLLRRFIEVCDTVAYAHRHGVVHRDIKPSNVLLGEFGETLVVDWGLARPILSFEGDRPNSRRSNGTLAASLLAEEPEGAIVGTPAFMSPEQAAGQLHAVGPATDIYSLGATLYYLLVGRPAFAGESVTDVVQLVRQGQFARPRSLSQSIPPALEAICLKAMAIDPADRYSSAADLGSDVQSFLDDVPTLAYREPLSSRVARWTRRHSMLVAWLLGGALLLAAALASGLFSLSRAFLVTKVARDQAQTGLEFAVQQRREALDGFVMAGSTVDRYFERLIEDPLLDEPDLLQLRQSLLMELRSFYEAIVQKPANDDQARTIQVAAAVNLARIIEETEGSRPALQAYERAERFARALPATPRAVWGDLHDGLGRAHGRIGELELSRSEFAAAVENREATREQIPNTAEQVGELADSLTGLALVLDQLNQPDAAVNQLTKALALRAQALEQLPADSALQRASGHGYFLLATIAIEQGLWPMAGDSLTKSIQLLEPIAGSQPRDLRIRFILAQARGLHADLIEREAAGAATAVAARRQAIDELKALCDEIPNSKEYRVPLARAILRQGQSMAVEAPEVARGMFAETVELLAPKDRLVATAEEQRDHALALYLLASVSPFAEREPLLRQAKLLVGALSGEQLQRTAANQLDTAIEQALAQPERMMAIDLAPLR